MAQKKTTTKSRKSTNDASGKAANGKRIDKVAGSKSSRNGSGSTANELTLRAWKHLYAKRDQFGKFD